MALEVDDMRRSLDDLEAKESEPVWGSIFRGCDARAEIHDPSGYQIEVG
jgi:hypothetical protein